MVRKPNDPLGLYIHIPFCHARCGYCDFVTFTGKEDQREAYVDALSKEIELYPRTEISTVFFGGGTPSVLEGDQLRRIFEALRSHFSIPAGSEISLEANPESADADKLRAWRDIGINRLSFGLQAYDDPLLKAMGRLHSVRQFESAYQLARAHRFDNISVDLIYGFNDQTLESWKETLRKTVALDPEHLSLYALKVEEHTPFGAQGLRVNDDLQAEMYDWARAYLGSQGFLQYEISNFAKPGCECRHNLIYWRGQDYLGLGVGAVGCADGLRWENQKNLGPYFNATAASRLPRVNEERLDPETRKFERLMLGLRLREGIIWDHEEDLSWVSKRAELAKQGYLEEMQPGTWRIAEPYIALTNQILLPFVPG